MILYTYGHGCGLHLFLTTFNKISFMSVDVVYSKPAQSNTVHDSRPFYDTFYFAPGGNQNCKAETVTSFQALTPLVHPYLLLSLRPN